MDIRSPLFKNIAAAVAGVLFINPVVALGANLALDNAAGGNTTLGQAGNGVPIVNIATPSGSGLSHNKFNEYNVGQQGLILNNATGATNSTQLGGIILGNPNLANGSAGVILNEVTGVNPTNLRGYTEVAGQRAGVIVANPHGITCDGCGFINTPRVTLSTGKPVVEQGALKHFDVEGGAISIQGAGLNATNVDRFDLITRSAQINANLHANQLNIVTGRNLVDATTLEATAKTGESSDKPMLALDSSALGGMYAGAIRLIGTEQGVGVRLAGDLAAHAGDIHIDANGQLSLGRTAAAGELNVKAQGVQLTRDTYAAGDANVQAAQRLSNQDALAAGGQIRLQANELSNSGLIEAGVRADNSRNAQADVTVQAQRVINSGTIVTSRALSISATESLDNRGGTLAADALNLTTQRLDNQQGRVLAERRLDLQAGQLDNRQGLLQSRGATNLAVTGKLDNRAGDLIAGGTLDLAAGSLDNSEQGLVAGLEQANITADLLDNRNGTINARQQLNIKANALNNRSGTIATDKKLQLDAGDLDNRGGEISAAESITLQSGKLDNSAGGRVITGGTLEVITDGLNNSQTGLLSGWQGVTITAADLSNREGGTVSSREGALTLDVAGSLDNSAEGALVSQGNQTIRASDLNNAGGFISGQTDVTLSVGGRLNSDAGVLTSGGSLDITAGQISNQAGYIGSTGPLLIAAESLDNRGGQLAGAGTLTLALTGALLNQSGQLTSSGPLRIQANQLDNRSGYLASQSMLELFGVDLLNSNGGILAAGTDLHIDLAGQLDNRQGGNLFTQSGALDISTGSLNNNGGAIQGKDISLDVKGGLSNQSGHLIALDTLHLQAGSLNNRGGRLGAVELAIDVAGQLDNSQGGNLFTQAGPLDIRAGSLNNNSGAIQGRSIALDVKGNVSNQNGDLVALDAITLQAQSLSNQGGRLGAAELNIATAGLLDNSSGLVEAGHNLAINAGSIDNRHGALRNLGAQGTTRIESHGLLDNSGGAIESASDVLWFQLPALANQNGVIRHVGGGKLQLASARLIEGGGSFITHGDLTIDAAHWVHSGLVQAAQLTLNIGHLEQTNQGRLLAGQSLRGTGQNWNNQGIIASDGLLDLQLSGQYAADGSLFGLNDTKLTAAQITLGNAGRIASGGDLALTAGFSLINRGRITAAGDLSANAATIHNFGTLGAAYNVNIGAGHLLNEHGLLFSGGDMTLNVDHLRNRYADIYSLGSLEIGQSNKGRSSFIENISATIESTGHLLMRAVNFINRKDVFAIEDEQIAGRMDVECRDCKGDHHEVYYIATETFQSRVVADSPSATLLSGGSMSLDLVTLENRHSTIAAAGDLFITADRLDNVSSAVGETTRVRRWDSGLITDGTDKRFREGFIYPYNDAALPKQLPLEELGRFTLIADNSTTTVNGHASPAIIQAGGLVQVRVKGELNNDVVVHQGVTGGTVRGADTSVGGVLPVVVVLNPKLPPDLAQQVVNPIALPGFTLPQGENGLFRISGQAGSGSATGAPSDQSVSQASGRTPMAPASGSHRYLIETNPALTDLRQFMSSDYMLGQLGFDPDAAQRRLGDGLYEQRLVREAVIARTGQRYLAGLTNDEDMFRYLMDNAVASKDALGLALGISLTAEQVAALTHDIVWMEEHEVMGERVLVPVLYLAQAEGRLAANGALIQGSDLDLIAGGDLRNQGTLRASDSLSARAENITNSGLMQAHERVQLVAMDSIRNTLGGVIAGRDVGLTATNGDIINERSVTYYQNQGNRWEQSGTLLDSAARIEASGNLSLNAGRDIINSGGVLQAGGDASLKAGNNLTISAVEERSSELRQNGRHHLETSQVVQHGSDVSIGGNLKAQAGNDLSIIGSRVEAGGDMRLAADNNLLIASAANEDHSDYRYRSSSRKTTQENHSITQQSSELIAGGNMQLYAGNDLTMVASRAAAEGDIAIGAERDVNILSGLDESSSYFQTQKKKSFGRSKSSQNESYDSTNVASQIEAGGRLLVNVGIDENDALTLEGGRNVNIIGSQLSAGTDLAIGALNDIAVLSAVEEHGAYSQKSKSGFLGLSKSGKSKLETQATQVSSELEAGNDLMLLAGNDVRLRASTAVAGNDTEIRAGLVTDTGDINLVSAQDAAYSLQESYRSKVGLSSSGNSISVASARKSGQEAMSSTAVGSQVVAERDTLLQAERDINVEGSRVVAGRNMTLDAGRDVNVVAATNSSSESQWNRTSQVGLSWGSDANSVSVFAGKESEQLRQAVVTNTASGSELLAGNDIQVSAGRTINQIGSALEAGRDIRMDAEENINILAAQESSVSDHQYSSSRQGIGVSVSHNYGNARDAAGNAGKGDNAVSQASGVLRAVDSISQFFAGPTAEMRVGSSSESVRQQQSIQGVHGSTLAAGNDVILNAGNDVTVTGSRLGAGRDVAVAGRDITFDVATGESSQQTEQQQSWAGVRGGNAGGLRAGIGFSQGESTQEGVQGTSTVSQINAGRDITLDATNNLTLVGTQAQAGRNIDLDAGNDIRILAAQNAYTADTNRSSSGMEVGATFGQSGVGAYVSGNQGRGFSERKGVRHQEAYLYAGNGLSFTSGRDTTIAGAQLSGQEVIGRVGRDLTVASVIDTGSARGKESDVSGTVTVGPGPGISGAVGSGRTSGSTQWVESQTGIIARDRLDIYTENHTQLDGALIASDTGNLLLDTGSFGFTDIIGHDRERSHYVSVGGSYGMGDSNVQQDPSQVGKGDSGVSGWSVEGNKYERDRQQNVRATVGEGEIIVRNDAETGEDSTAGLNRDVERAYEITRDREESTDLYVTGSSVAAVANPVATAEAWAASAQAAVNTAIAAVDRVHNEIQAQRVNMDQVPAGAIDALGEEQALAFAKNLVRSGLSPEDLEKLPAQALINLANWAATAALANERGSQENTGGSGTSSSDSSSVRLNPDDSIALADMIVTGKPGSNSPGMAFLESTADLRTYINTLPVEQAQIAMIGVQALMGPAKAAVSLAGNVVVGALFGDQIDALKERGAVGMTAGLSGDSRPVVQGDHDAAKAEFNRGNQDFDNGDHLVLGSLFLIDVVSGSIGGPGRGSATTVGANSQGSKGAGSTNASSRDADGIKGSRIPVAQRTNADNGLDYQSNPKHTPNQPGYNRRAGTEPPNSLALFGTSTQSGRKRYAKDEHGAVHQFTNTNDGSWHWSGSTSDHSAPLNTSTIPNDIRKKLDLPRKGW